MRKNFKTYNSQMKFLRDEKNIVCNGSQDKRDLVRNGYFNLINGYKSPFLIKEKDNDAGSYTYIGKTKLAHFVAVKNFDVELRMHLMKYIVQVEEEIRTVVAYKFDEMNNKGVTKWYEVESYDENIDVQHRMKVISKCFNEVDKCKQGYMKHYLQKHKEVPTWVFVKALNLSTFIEFYGILKSEVKVAICDLYSINAGDYDECQKLFIAMLHWIRKIRNGCAHNERVYGTIKENGRLKKPFIEFLPKRKIYQQGRTQRIMDLVVYLRYFLPNDEYKCFIDVIKNLLLYLESQINKNAFDKVRADMGIRKIADLETLENTKKEIFYNLF